MNRPQHIEPDAELRNEFLLPFLNSLQADQVAQRVDYLNRAPLDFEMEENKLDLDFRRRDSQVLNENDSENEVVPQKKKPDPFGVLFENKIVNPQEQKALQTERDVLQNSSQNGSIFREQSQLLNKYSKQQSKYHGDFHHPEDLIGRDVLWNEAFRTMNSEINTLREMPQMHQEQLLESMVDSFYFTFINNEYGDNSLDRNFRTDNLRSVAQSFTSMNGTDLNLFKVSGELKLVRNYSDYERIVVFFMVRNPLIYHRLIELLYCGEEQDDYGCFSRIGMIYMRADNFNDVGIPVGRIARALALQLRELIAVSGNSLKRSLQMMITDTSFSDARPRAGHNRKKPYPLIIFTMDTPGQFSEALMLTFRSMLHTALGYELCKDQSFSYGVYKFELPDYGEWGRNPCWKPFRAAQQ